MNIEIIVLSNNLSLIGIFEQNVIKYPMSFYIDYDNEDELVWNKFLNVELYKKNEINVNLNQILFRYTPSDSIRELYLNLVISSLNNDSDDFKMISNELEYLDAKITNKIH